MVRGSSKLNQSSNDFDGLDFKWGDNTDATGELYRHAVTLQAMKF